jgi:hypothetical protein
MGPRHQASCGTKVITGLLCADATDPAAVERLLGGARAAMAFTDPPYNVALGHHGGHARGTRRRAIANDALDPVAWEAFVRAWATTLLGRSMAGHTSA